jgi:uncharacterized protein DUF3761
MSLRRPIRAAVLVAATLAALSFTSASAASDLRVDVALTPDGPWTSELLGPGSEHVRSVVYYIRDGHGVWRHGAALTAAPFTEPFLWWEGDNSDYEVVTAHVVTTSGQTVKDPGGWHWVNGHHADPGGSITGTQLKDGSAAVSYSPTNEQGTMVGAEFWFRDSSGSWSDAGAGVNAGDNSWRLSPLPRTTSSGWQGDQVAASVHVLWPNGSQTVDPAPWATTFGQELGVGTSTELLPSLPSGPVALPNHALTPGVSLPGVTAINVCTSGWAAAHRHVTSEQHSAVFLEYGLSYPQAAGSYELDHLIPLELGGTNDNRNLWPEPAVPAPGFHQKDLLENKLHELVCAGTVALPVAQSEISTDWFAAYTKYEAVSVQKPAATTAVATPAPTPLPAPPPAQVAPPPIQPAPPPPADPLAQLRAMGVSAICNDGSYSYSQHRSGTCSHHLGVRTWTGLI